MPHLFSRQTRNSINIIIGGTWARITKSLYTSEVQTRTDFLEWVKLKLGAILVVYSLGLMPINSLIDIQAAELASLEQITISTDIDANLIQIEDGIDDSSAPSTISQATDASPQLEEQDAQETEDDQSTQVAQNTDEPESETNPEPGATESSVTETEATDDLEVIRAGLEKSIQGWAYAWANQDIEKYLSYYADEFVPDDSNLSKTEWENLRRVRLSRPKVIKLNLAEIKMNVSDNDIKTVTFKQSYQSDSYRDKVIKQLEMIEHFGQWKILSERSIEKL